MTILTGLWESTYLSTYSSVVNSASQLVNNTEHVWSNKYDESTIQEFTRFPGALIYFISFKENLTPFCPSVCDQVSERYMGLSSQL